MSNTNGLISSRAVCSNGSSDSNLYLRPGDVVPTPVFITSVDVKSPNGNEDVIVSIDNTGLTIIAGTGEIDIVPAVGDVLVSTDSTNEIPAGLLIKPQNAEGLGFVRIFNGTESVHYDFSVASESSAGRTSELLQVFGASGAGIRQVLNADALGSEFLIGDSGTAGGTLVSVNGPLGASRVFDTLYNPVVFPVSNVGQLLTQAGQESSLTTTFALPQGDVFPAIQFQISKTGFYMLQASFDAGAGSGALALGGTPLTAIPQGSPLLQSGAFFFMNAITVPPTVIPGSSIGCSYQQMKDNQVTSTVIGEIGFKKQTMLLLTEGIPVEISYVRGETPTGGVVSVQLIQMC